MNKVKTGQLAFLEGLVKLYHQENEDDTYGDTFSNIIIRHVALIGPGKSNRGGSQATERYCELEGYHKERINEGIWVVVGVV